MATIKRVKNCWFIEVSGKLTRMNILKDAKDVHLEDNIIFADDLVFQIVESDGQIALSEIKEISQKEQSEHENKDFVLKTMQEDVDKKCEANDRKDEVDLNEKNVNYNNCDDEDELTDGNKVENSEISSEDSSENNKYSDYDDELSDEKEDNYFEISSEEEYIPRKDFNKCDGSEVLSDDDDVDNPEKNNEEYESNKDFNNGDGSEVLPDDDEVENPETSSEEYVSSKGGIKGFFNRLRKKVTRAPASKQQRRSLEQKGYQNIEKSYEDIDIGTDCGGPDIDAHADCDFNKCDGSEILPDDNEVETPEKSNEEYESAVPEPKIVTALFDFKQFTNGEISFHKGDTLRLHGVKMTDTCDWCLTENMTSGEEGYIPMAYVTDDIHALQAQDWWYDISRKEACKLLSSCRCSVGTFLIRPLESKTGNVLSLLAKGEIIVHYGIMTLNGRLYIDSKKTFQKIEELIDFYKENTLGLRGKLVSPPPKAIPLVYPRNMVIGKESISCTDSFICGAYGEMFQGKLFNNLDVTIVTELKQTLNEFMVDSKLLYEFRKSRHFVKLFAVIVKPKPFMMILGETIRCTLQQHLMLDGGKTVTFKTLTDIAAEVASGMDVLEMDNIVHGQLKADNIFVCEFHQVKIVHPKLCEMMKVRYNDNHRKMDNKWKWIAPEAGSERFTTKSDVWSYGVLLYELITFGKEPYEGFTERCAFRNLRMRYRLPKPNGPVLCPAAFYVTILKCWHSQPECRPTFNYLSNFFHDFEVAVEYEVGIEDANIYQLYMRGTLEIESYKTDEKGELIADRVKVRDIQIKSEHSEQPVTSIEEKASNITVQDIKISRGFSVKALNYYETVSENEISFRTDDIITDVEPAHDGWWIGTAPNGLRGLFRSDAVEVYENAYAEVHNTDKKIKLKKVFKRMWKSKDT